MYNFLSRVIKNTFDNLGIAFVEDMIYNVKNEGACFNENSYNDDNTL